MNQQSKLSAKQELSIGAQMKQESGQEFKSSDELLRFDAAQVAVPPEVGQKLQKSSAGIRPAGARPWWKNFFRK